MEMAEGGVGVESPYEGVEHDVLYAAGAEFRSVGYSAMQLSQAWYKPRAIIHAGYDAQTLPSLGFPDGEILEAGILASELKVMGFDASTIFQAGYTAQALRGARFTAKEMVVRPWFCSATTLIGC